MSNILVIAQVTEGEVKRATNSAVTFAKTAAQATGGTYSILALGDDLSAASDALSKLGAAKVILVEGAGLNNGIAEQWAPAIEQVVKTGAFTVVVSPASSIAKDVMPRVAYRLDAGMASEVSALDTDGDTLTYTRPMYAGNVNGKVQITTPVQVVTIRATEFEPAAADASASPVEKVAPAAPSPAMARLTFNGFDKSVSARPDLAEARVVVSGGRGLKSQENFKILEDLADLVGGAVGGTRAAVDAGFIHNDFQVGQTGKIVAPELYLAVGLSGALQHVAGMKSSKVVVAINKDEEAEIFQIADYGIVGDLFKIVPELQEQIKKVAK